MLRQLEQDYFVRNKSIVIGQLERKKTGKIMDYVLSIVFDNWTHIDLNIEINCLVVNFYYHIYYDETSNFVLLLNKK